MYTIMYIVVHGSMKSVCKHARSHFTIVCEEGAVIHILQWIVPFLVSSVCVKSQIASFKFERREAHPALLTRVHTHTQRERERERERKREREAHTHTREDNLNNLAVSDALLVSERDE